MADIEQWVNLTVSEKWRDNGVPERKNLGELIRVKIDFQNQRQARFKFTGEADAGNASYSNTEEPRRAGFRGPRLTARRFRTNRQGVKFVRTRLTLAGGDRFRFKGEDKDGNTVESDWYETRRKLYYQVIKMNGVAALSAADLNDYEDDYWQPGAKLYVKMVQISPGRTIPSRINFNRWDPAVRSQVLTQARGQYDRSKSPYCFAMLAVNKICQPGWDRRNIPDTFAGLYILRATKPLFDVVDPAEDWYDYIRWVPSAAGVAPVDVPKHRCTRLGNTQININTIGLPQGAGRLFFKLKIVNKAVGGFSVRTDNFTCVATQRWDGAAYPPVKVRGIINHEVGHKVGMVAGPQGTPALDPQAASYYDGRGHQGPHCYTGTILRADMSTGPPGTCVMFGSTRANTTVFCGSCKPSLRKLDLRSRSNLGIRTQF